MQGFLFLFSSVYFFPLNISLFMLLQLSQFPPLPRYTHLAPPLCRNFYHTNSRLRDRWLWIPNETSIIFNQSTHAISSPERRLKLKPHQQGTSKSSIGTYMQTLIYFSRPFQSSMNFAMPWSTVSNSRLVTVDRCVHEKK